MKYNIEGEPLPVVICELDANETMITEKGAMSWMTPNMKMETSSNGGVGKMLGRAFSGESMFQRSPSQSQVSVRSASAKPKSSSPSVCISV